MAGMAAIGIAAGATPIGMANGAISIATTVTTATTTTITIITEVEQRLRGRCRLTITPIRSVGQFTAMR
jgi:hypothetical protein